jgi:hypothetical protein
MNKKEIGRIIKSNITLIEYAESTVGYSDKFFLMSGAVGFWATKEELKDLYTVLNYYINIEDISECTVEVEE